MCKRKMTKLTLSRNIRKTVVRIIIITIKIMMSNKYNKYLYAKFFVQQV